MSIHEEIERTYNILVFGAERMGLPLPPEPIKNRNFTLYFEKYGTPRRFQEFDGVILFQGIFEHFDLKPTYSSSYLQHSCDTDELDKRKKEAMLLAGQGGFMCFLLNQKFIDQNEGRNFSSTDLAKFHLNYPSLYRDNFGKRVANIKPLIDEFKRFIEIYGAASSYFKNHNEHIDYRILATFNDYPVGLIINGLDYFVPSLIPDARPEVIAEFFELLADGLTSTHNKLHQAAPEWVSSYKFEEETSIKLKVDELEAQLSEFQRRRDELEHYKAALFYTGSELVSIVGRILSITIDVTIDGTDELREDLKLLDASNVPIALCEVKGINRGIKRENINQTDSHRERSGFAADFPSILIANTGIKSSRTIDEKDQEIADEQVRHAIQMRILLIRTLDLLGLLRLVLSGKLSTDEARDFMIQNVGWLRVQADEVSIITGK